MRGKVIPKVSRKVVSKRTKRNWSVYELKRKRVVRINRETDALGVIDATGAFMPNHFSRGRKIPKGGLPVTDGHKIIPVILGIYKLFAIMFATRDRHKKGHISWVTSFVGLPPVKTVLTPQVVKKWTDGNHRISLIAKFSLAWLKVYLKRAKYQTLWPEHGEDGTEEAEIHPELRGLPFFLVQDKGQDPFFDAYSAIYDNFERSSGLSGKLHRRRIKRVFLVGLALDYCVGYTALGLVKEGFEVYIVLDGTRSVAKKSEREMLRKLRAAGVLVIYSKQLRPAK